MQITCWGARGSVAVSGPEYVRYGGETSCLELRDGSGNLIVIDAGTGARRLGHKLVKQGPVEATLLLTHAHWDHIAGFPFFAPVHRASTKLSVICCAFTHGFVKTMLEYTMAPPYFPLPLKEVRASLEYPEVCAEKFRLHGLTVEPIRLSHPNGGTGFRFTEGGKKFVFLTDNQLGYSHPNGLPEEDYLEFCQGADLLIHDAEYTPEEYEKFPLFGHSSYVAALDLALAARVARFGLFHHNQLRTDDQIDQLVADCRERVARAGQEMEVFALSTGLTLDL